MKSWFNQIKFPSLKSSLLAFFSGILLILAFPDFEFWFFAYFALIPLFFAIELEKESFSKSFITGWIFGITFFTGTCWWLTYSLINYGGIPTVVSYLLLLAATGFVGLYPALFAGLFSLILKRFGTWGILSAPFLWTATEFLRFWTSGNSWNTIAYSQAFNPLFLSFASLGGIYLVGFVCVASSACYAHVISQRDKKSAYVAIIPMLFLIVVQFYQIYLIKNEPPYEARKDETRVVAIQPNVPMSSIKYEDWLKLRERHVQLAERELQKIKSEIPNPKSPIVVIFPESPMNFGWTEDRDFQAYLRDFIQRNNVEVLFNAAEPTEKHTYYNSAVLVNSEGRKIGQYDKIHLVPFGEFVPFPEPLASMVPTVAGNFEPGKEYDIFPLGDVKSGILICFESHFPTLSRQFVLNGADVLVEMTNDGYLGPTPVLRQHLASAVFRAVETNRPVLRVTNVGITGYINERGEVIEPSQPYTEESRTWSVSKSDGSQTFYVRYGDWFAWTCSIVSLVILFLGFWKKKSFALKN